MGAPSNRTGDVSPVRCELPSDLLLLGRRHPALIRELGLHGGRLVTDSPIEYGTMFDLLFELGSSRIWLSCMALGRDPDGFSFRYHLTTPLHKQAVDAFVRQGSPNGG
jgi:hypothetical protein